MQLLRVSDGAVIEEINAPRKQWYPASWSPNGQAVLLTDNNAFPAFFLFSLEKKTLTPVPKGLGEVLWLGPQELVRTSIPHASMIVQSPNRQLAAVLQTGGSWQLWDLRTDRVILAPGANWPPSQGRALVWSPDSTQVAYFTQSGEIDVWDLTTAKLAARWKIPAVDGMLTLVWSDRLTAVENAGGAVRVWRER